MLRDAYGSGRLLGSLEAERLAREEAERLKREEEERLRREEEERYHSLSYTYTQSDISNDSFSGSPQSHFVSIEAERRAKEEAERLKREEEERKVSFVHLSNVLCCFLSSFRFAKSKSELNAKRESARKKSVDRERKRKGLYESTKSNSLNKRGSRKRRYRQNSVKSRTSVSL